MSTTQRYWVGSLIKSVYLKTIGFPNRFRFRTTVIVSTHSYRYLSEVCTIHFQYVCACLYSCWDKFSLESVLHSSWCIPVPKNIQNKYRRRNRVYYRGLCFVSKLLIHNLLTPHGLDGPLCDTHDLSSNFKFEYNSF